MMSQLVTVFLLGFLLADAKHSSEDDATYQVNQPGVLFLVGLVQNDPRTSRQAQMDPNILLLYSDSIHSTQWDNPEISRPVRGMSTERPTDLSTGYETGQPFNLIDMLLRSRRRLSPAHGNVPVPSMWLHPPPIEAPHNQQARSESSDTSAPNDGEEPVDSEEGVSEKPPLSAIMSIPDLLLDLGHTLTQPLWVDKSKNRESHEFGMIAKAPLIICPLGFQRDLLGNCRPVFRSRRGFVISRIRLTLGKKNKPEEELSSPIQAPEEDKEEEQDIPWITTTIPTMIA